MNKIKFIYLLLLSIINIPFGFGQSSQLRAVCAESSHYYGVEDGLPGSTFLWAVEAGGIIVQDDGDSILVQWGYNTGEFMMEVVEYSTNGCSGAPVMAIATVQAPEVDLGFDFYEICDGESESFDASGDYDGIPTYVWHDGSDLSYYVADSTEVIWVRVTDGLGCVRYDSLEFIAHKLPVVSLGNDTIHCHPEDPLEIDAGNFASYDWTVNNEGFVGNPIYVYRNTVSTDTVKVVVTDNNGCTDADTMLIYPCDAARMFDDMVNTFTPDGDGANDTWVILKDGKMDQFPDAVLEIFDRWGRLVYRTENVDGEPWNGRSKGRDMPMDAYFFVLEINYGGFEPITGTVNLIR